MPEPLHLSGFGARRQPQAAVPVGGPRRAGGFPAAGQARGSALQGARLPCACSTAPFLRLASPETTTTLVIKCFLSIVLFSLGGGQARGRGEQDQGLRNGVTTAR